MTDKHTPEYFNEGTPFQSMKQQHTPETIFRKVYCKDRLPEKEGIHDTDFGFCAFDGERFWQQCTMIGADWWLEEVPNPIADIPNPAEWVEKMKESFKMVELMNGMLTFLTQVKNEGKPFISRIQMFEHEEDSVDIVLWASVANVCDSPVKRVTELADERNNLQSELEAVKKENERLSASIQEVMHEREILEYKLKTLSELYEKQIERSISNASDEELDRFIKDCKTIIGKEKGNE